MQPYVWASSENTNFRGRTWKKRQGGGAEQMQRWRKQADFHFPFYSISFTFFHLLIILSRPTCFWQYMLLLDPASTTSVSSPLRNKEVKVWKETNGEEESMRWRWQEMAVRISILGWDSISIIDIDLRSLLCCLSQGALLSVCLFTGWVKLEINSSCLFEGSHKQHSVTS